MSKKYEKYDVASKIALVEEYLELSKIDDKLNISKFAKSKGIANSTFNDWILKYKRNNNSLVKIDDNDVIDMNVSKPKFIEISNDTITKVESVINTTNTIKLHYKDITLEFNNNDLVMVMEMIRRW